MASSEMEDGQLLQAVARGDQDALLTLHQRYVNLVYSMAWRVLQDVGLAEEVTQDIFLKLWHKGHQYDPAAGPVFKLASERDRVSPRSTGCAAKAGSRRKPRSRRATRTKRRRWSDCCRPITRRGSAVSICDWCWHNCRSNSVRSSSWPTLAG